MFRIMDTDYSNKVSNALYRINKEAKVLRDKASNSDDRDDRFNLRRKMNELYYMKDDILKHLYDTGNLEIIGYHVLYYDFDEDKDDYIPAYGVLTRIPGTVNTFHTPYDIDSYSYGSLEKLGIEDLGEMDDLVSANIRKNEDIPSYSEAINILNNFLDDNWEFDKDYEEYYN